MPKSKVDIDQVEHSARSLNLEPEKVQQLINDLRRSLEEEAQDKAPRLKKQLVIIANIGGNEELEEIVKEIPMQVVEFPVDEDHNSILQKVYEASYDFNASPKNENKRVETVFEALENIKPEKHFKSRGLSRKSKSPLIVLTTNNLIPTE